MPLVTLDGDAIPASRVFVQRTRRNSVTVGNGGEQVHVRDKGASIQIRIGSGRVARKQDLAALLPEVDDATHTLVIDWDGVITDTYTVAWAADIDYGIRSGLNAEQFTLRFVEVP